MTKESATLAAGCFWCIEAAMDQLEGIESVESGYIGGTTANPSYQQICTGTTGHAEAVRIEYDPAQVSYKSLLTVFFGSHDPTTKDRQGADVGTQYRSVIFYTTPEQKAEAERFIRDMNDSNSAGAPVVTEVEPLDAFYEAEDYHQNYYANHRNAGYCQVVINPKLEKVQKEFADLLKTIEQ